MTPPPDSIGGLRQMRLVAGREMRERARSKAFRIAWAAVSLGVIAVIVLPSVLSKHKVKQVGLTGSAPSGLTALIEQGAARSSLTVRTQPYDSVAAGEAAARKGTIAVLLVDGQRLEWKREADAQLRAVIVEAVQVASIRDRGAALGLDATAVSGLLAPVSVQEFNLEPPSRPKDDIEAASIATIILFIAVTTYGSLVMTGVLEEKSSRVVEVLLARIPARSLLAGKVLGIGTLGLLQLVGTAAVALVTLSRVHTVSIPAVRPVALAWIIVWFALGYTFFAVIYGALGSLATRVEDAQSAAAPMTFLLLIGYFLSLASVSNPDVLLARIGTFIPFTAPFVAPMRVGLGAAAWWEPVVAAILTAASIWGLVVAAGRLYSGAVLHIGQRVGFRQAWRGADEA